MNKYVQPHPFTDPEAAAHKLIEPARAFRPIQDERVYIEAINGPFLFEHKGTPAEYSPGLKLAIERGWLELHESGTFVKFTRAGTEFASESPTQGHLSPPSCHRSRDRDCAKAIFS